MLRSEKEPIETVVNMKADEMNKLLTGENNKVQQMLRSHYDHQREDNAFLQATVNQLKNEKAALDMHLIDLERRQAEVELQVGSESQQPLI